MERILPFIYKKTLFGVLEMQTLENANHTKCNIVQHACVNYMLSLKALTSTWQPKEQCQTAGLHVLLACTLPFTNEYQYINIHF